MSRVLLLGYDPETVDFSVPGESATAANRNHLAA